MLCCVKLFFQQLWLLLFDPYCFTRWFAPFFYEINRIDGRTTLKLICRHERCSRKLARYTNHLTFLTRCIKNRVVPKDLRVRPPVPTKGARRVAELASMRFLRERIRLTQKTKEDAKKDTESTAQSITSALSTNDANRILEQIKTNTQRIFNTTKDRHKQKFEKLNREKQAAVTKLTGLLIYLLGPLAMPRKPFWRKDWTSP